MDSFAEVALIFLGIIVFLRVRDGNLGDWLRSKFFNSAAPAPDRPPRLRAVDATAGSFGDRLAGGLGDAAQGAVIATGGFVMPADGPITSGFGPRRRPCATCSADHKGVDIDGATGDPVRAARGGRVTYAGNSGGYGLRVDIDHGRGFSTRYGHLYRLGVNVGQSVSAGERIGDMGATGNATGAHLHFETRVHGTPVDPAQYLPALVGGG